MKGKQVRMRAAALSLVIAMWPRAAAHAQTDSSAVAGRVPRVMDVFSRTARGDYITPFLEFARNAPAYLGDSETRGVFTDFYAYLSTWIGHYADGLAIVDSVNAVGSNAAPAANSFAGYRARSAAAVIAEQARSHQMVMINEAHYSPRDRAFTLTLLRELHAAGFKYLALEAASSRDTALNARKYPVGTSGLYIRDPVYGDMVRTALQLGFIVVPYDTIPRCTPEPGAPNMCISRRDSLAATRLIARTIAHDPSAKVLVHAGYSHVMHEERHGAVTLGVWITRLTGSAPFSVDQTHMTEHRVQRAEPPTYRQALAAGLVGDGAVILESAGGAFWRDSAATQVNGVDAMVIHPREQLKDGRPTWLGIGGHRRAFHLTADVRHRLLDGVTDTVMLEAHAVGEIDTAVPVDMVLYSPADPIPVLFLPLGEYELRVRNEHGEIARRVTVTVRAGTAP